MLYSGIDLHKRTLAIHTVDAAGTLVRKADLPTRREAVTAYFATLDGPHQAVCECTSMWYWVRDLLVPHGIDLRLAHAKYLMAISYAKVKTDAVDAATMAQLLRVQLIPKAHMIRDGIREVRDLLRSRLVLVSRGIAVGCDRRGHVDDQADDTRCAIAGCTATTPLREQHVPRTLGTCVPLTRNSLRRLGGETEQTGRAPVGIARSRGRQYGPRKRSPLKWIRCVAASAHHTSVSQAI